MRIQAFATKTGVTVRTLHHYDRLGLLKPQRTSKGYRLYGETELLRLQRITVLKFIGCSLQEIKRLLDRTPDDLRVTLDLQHEALERRKASLDAALEAVREAKNMLEHSGTPDWQSLKKIVEVLEMEQNMEWMKKYYSPEAQRALEERRATDPGVVEKGQQDWAALLADCERAVAKHVDPAGEEGRSLAQRWIALVQNFTQGNPQLTQGLNRMYEDSGNWPGKFQRPWSDEVDAFIKKAKAAADLRCES